MVSHLCAPRGLLLQETSAVDGFISSSICQGCQSPVVGSWNSVFAGFRANRELNALPLLIGPSRRKREGARGQQQVGPGEAGVKHRCRLGVVLSGPPALPAGPSPARASAPSVDALLAPVVRPAAAAEDGEGLSAGQPQSLSVLSAPPEASSGWLRMPWLNARVHTGPS
eukprot:scaffold240865_cov30-Prasinocladus_malaysianus.AAC.1